MLDIANMFNAYIIVVSYDRLPEGITSRIVAYVAETAVTKAHAPRATYSKFVPMLLTCGVIVNMGTYPALA